MEKPNIEKRIQVLISEVIELEGQKKNQEDQDMITTNAEDTKRRVLNLLQFCENDNQVLTLQSALKRLHRVKGSDPDAGFKYNEFTDDDDDDDDLMPWDKYKPE